jgi:hypothetical protein
LVLPVASGAQIGNSAALRNDAAAGDDDLRALARAWRRALPEDAGAGDDSAAVIAAAVRELASLFTVLAESGGRHGSPLSTATRDLIRHPAGQSRYQTLVMLAGAVAWFSRDSGRPETEILDGLAASFPFRA